MKKLVWGVRAAACLLVAISAFGQTAPPPPPPPEPLNDEMGSLVLRPHKQVTTSSEFHSLKLAQGNDLWYAGGGAFQPWTFGYSGRATEGRTALGNLYDTNLEYRFNRHFTFTGYVGYMQGLTVMKFIYPAGKDARFGLVEMLFKF